MKLLSRLFGKKDAVEKSCFTCKWFKRRTEAPRIRVCTYPGRLKREDVRQGYCSHWELEPDPQKRKRTFI